MQIAMRKILSGLYPERFSDRARRIRSSVRMPMRIGALLYSRWKLLLFLLIVSHVFVFLYYYNTFLSLKYDVAEARAQVDTQLQRRKNIILNLHIMVEDYARHEKDLFEHTSETRKEMLRSKPASPDGPRPGAKMLLPIPAGNLDALLSGVLALAERYPALRLSESFQSFMEALVDAESKVAEQRMIYNERANDFSTILGQFPGYLFAKMYGFESPEFFESDDDAKKPVKVSRLGT